MSRRAIRPVLICALLAAGLLFDPLCFLRMTLLCAVLHESGHVLAYLLCTGHFPRLSVRPEGIMLSGAEKLSSRQELFVIAAGPGANFVFSVLLLLLLNSRASYGLYFLSAVSLCTGIYNLMPVGILDGARILQNLCPPEKLDALQRLQQICLFVFCAGMLIFSVQSRVPLPARIAALFGTGYLLLAQSGKGS